MVNDIYFYKYKEREDIINEINKLNIVRYSKYNDLDIFEIELVINDKVKFKDIDRVYNLEYKIITVIIKNSTICLIIEEDTYIKYLSFINKLDKINLLDNRVFYNLLKEDITNNIVSLKFKSLSSTSQIDDADFIGYNILNSRYLYDIEEYINNELTTINAYSFQPKALKCLVHIKSKNKIELSSKDYDYIQILDFIDRFIYFIESIN